MSEFSTALAKLAGTMKAVQKVLTDCRQPEGHRQIGSFDPRQVQHYFENAATQLEVLRLKCPDLYSDFVTFPMSPDTEMMIAEGSNKPKWWFSREQLLRLIRDIEQVFEIRSNSELAAPLPAFSPKRRVFISHGRAKDWYEVQIYIEKDIGFETLELAQEANQGRTILEKLNAEANNCDSAVIVMTGDDLDSAGQARARENVIHEIGFFQGKYGLSRVCLMHEEGVSIPSNIHGLVYTPFTKDAVSAAFGLLNRELKVMYR